MDDKKSRKAKSVVAPRPEYPSGRPPLSPRVFEAIRRRSRAFFRGARGSHDWDHTERVYRLCLRIDGKRGPTGSLLAASS
jgi:hypothetical protein